VCLSSDTVKIALAQINPTVGDIAGNCERIIQYIRRAAEQRADLVVFPELAITGYPPRDLLLKAHFIRRNVDAVHRIAEHSRDLVVIVGYAARSTNARGAALRNAAAICSGGALRHTCGKSLLPTYDVFDERRYFEPDTASNVVPITIGGVTRRMGVSICEDLWNEQHFERADLYDRDPIAEMAGAGAELLINIAASPFSLRRQETRVGIFQRQVARHHVPLAYVNQVGGNDDLLFDGASALFDADGKLVAQAAAFEEGLLVATFEPVPSGPIQPYPEPLDSAYRALVMGTRDYVRKCGFTDVVVGLSGGIDSAVTVAVAAAALGPQRVHGVAMPSRYSSDHSLSDARKTAEGLGIDFREISIEPVHQAAEQVLAESFEGTDPGVAEENLQARARGNILMALSNKFGWLLLSTGNKSELAVGYCTLYGDMCGGLAVISDVPKMMVYDLARHINTVHGQPVIPESVLTKAPSAELRPNQTDQDSLPAYAELDAILSRYVEQEQSVDQIVEAGCDRQTVAQIAHRVDANEYKRRQAAIGLKVTSRAFGTGRRMPVAARFDQIR